VQQQRLPEDLYHSRANSNGYLTLYLSPFKDHDLTYHDRLPGITSKTFDKAGIFVFTFEMQLSSSCHLLTRSIQRISFLKRLFERKVNQVQHQAPPSPSRHSK
jgi:hypothetical protein